MVQEWLDGDPGLPAASAAAKRQRNSTWKHLYNDDVLSMPDKWEYPWYAAWDLAFHMIPLALIDPDFAKRQLSLLLREWYMHPNGQLPAYEWEFSDVNPPVHAWACWRVFKIDWKLQGRPDFEFLERVFHKLLMNFTWWVNRKDAEGNNIFQGGFLGLDNIGVFDRAQAAAGRRTHRAGRRHRLDGDLLPDMLAIALELAQHDVAYEDIASKFFEHFLYIADAMNEMTGGETGLWDDRDGFFYDQIVLADGSAFPVSFALARRFAAAARNRDDLAATHRAGARLQAPHAVVHREPARAAAKRRLHGNGGPGRSPAACHPRRGELRRLLRVMLDENEFLSPNGIRSLSKHYEQHPYIAEIGQFSLRVDYDPAESRSGLFGGNSNWRGPIWFPINFLIIEALQNFHFYHGDDFRVEFPTGSGHMATLWEVASNLSQRLVGIFTRGADGRRPFNGSAAKAQTDARFRDLFLFYEYFHGDNGAGVGASHQTGWTGLVAKLIQQLSEYEGSGKSPLDWTYEAAPVDGALRRAGDAAAAK